MLSFKNDKCVQQSLMQKKEKIEKLEKELQPYINLKDKDLETESIVQDLSDNIKKEKQEIKDFEQRLSPYIHKCDGCTDEYFRTGRGFGREDCPLKGI